MRALTVTRTRMNRRTAAPPAQQCPGPTRPELTPTTRAEFDTAIAVLQRLASFSQASSADEPDGPAEAEELGRWIARLELYRDWWAPTFLELSVAPAVTARIADLEAQVRRWPKFSRRNEDRAKKAQRELEQTTTTRRHR